MASRVFDLIGQEELRQATTVELIASENFVSSDVLRAVGSCLTNKYSEGYPAHRAMGNQGRYYGGCHIVDELEEYCVSKWKEVFSTDYHVNVQPHSGSSANLAAYMALLQPGDTVLAMSLSNGGHLTHGSPVNFSGKLYDLHFYDVDDDGFIDYDGMERMALALRPKLIIAGASAYSRTIDFARFAAAAQEVGACFMVDMAHIAGLVGGRGTPQSLRSGGCHHHHHPQDPAGATRRPDLLPSGAGQEGGQRRIPRHAGRPAAARHRRQGRSGGGGPDAGLPRLRPQRGGQLQGHGGGVHGHGLPRGHRRHR